MADKVWSKIKDRLLPNVFKAAEGDAEMRALVLVHGRAEMSDEVRMPSLSSTQVLVRVHCYGLSRADRAQAALLGSVLGKKRADELDGILRRQGAPFGVNVCGTVVQLGWKGGDRVHMFPIAIGDEVYGFTEGSSSEFVVCEASKVALKPDSLSDEMAATLPVAGLTALQSLKFNKFGDGQAIMVLGAQDATGSLFAQLALELGASRIVAVCEPEFEPYCSTIAGEVYDFDSFDQHIPEMDLIVDVVTSHLEEKNATLFARCRETMKPGAHFVAANAGLVDVLRKRATKKLGFDVQRSGFDAADYSPNSDDLIRVVESLLPGFAIPIDEIPFESEAILDAYAQLHDSPRATRPVIVRIWHPSKDLHEVIDRRHTVKRN